MKKLTLWALLFVCQMNLSLAQKPFNIQFEQSKNTVEVADFVEVTLRLKKAVTNNPFKDATILGSFTTPQGKVIAVEGFCDSPDGTLSRLRFMPNTEGVHSFVVTYAQGGKKEQFTGQFTAVKSARRGIVQVDSLHPWHFIYGNSGKHFFWNSTTTYWILGWKDEKIIENAIDRLAGLDINRIRVAINARAHGGDRWAEPTVVESKNFTFKLNPWLAEKPDDLDAPNFDVTRFNVPHWQKLDRLVARAREKGIIVSLIFYVDGLDHGCDPFKKAQMGNENEQLYYRYAAARYGAYENIMWDIANEYHLFRTPEWAEKMGNFLKSKDHAQHLISVHGNADFPFRRSPWVDAVMYQSWDECGGFEFMNECRKKQAESGRILPQINEEYGYENTYPVWGCGATASKIAPDGRSADNRRRLAWEIYMAGGYQTTGETAQYGTGAGEDSGGGWINGRGNDKMTMLPYYAIIKRIFEKTDYWKMTPQYQLVNYGNMCLAEAGKTYLVYSRLQHCRVRLPADQKYTVTMINPRTGEETTLPDADTNADNNAWQYRKNLVDDWVFILKRK